MTHPCHILHLQPYSSLSLNGFDMVSGNIQPKFHHIYPAVERISQKKSRPPDWNLSLGPLDEVRRHHGDSGGSMSTNLEKIINDADKHLKELHSCWEQESLSTQMKTERMKIIHQELQDFWNKKMSEEKLNVLKYKVGQLRNEIETWWDRCFFSDKEREEFEVYKSTHFSELLLDSHMKELQRLKRRYANNEHLFLMIKKHQDTWNKVVKIDKQLYNPERLFQNRGAQLLQEERDRKIAQKDLPRLEEQIKRETTNYERENRIPFLIFGKRFSETILIQKEQHKENLKSLRSSQERMLQGGSYTKKSLSSPTSKHALCKRCGDCIPQTSGIPTKANSVSKLKRKIHTPSPSQTMQSKMARIATYDQIPSKFARPHNGRRLPIRRKLIDRKIIYEQQYSNVASPS